MILQLLFLILLLLIVAHLVESVQDIQRASSSLNWSSEDYERAGIAGSLCAKVTNVILSSYAASRPRFALGVATAQKTGVLKLLLPSDASAISSRENSNRYAESHYTSSPLVIQPDNVLPTRGTLENRIRKKT